MYGKVTRFNSWVCDIRGHSIARTSQVLDHSQHSGGTVVQANDALSTSRSHGVGQAP